jgi:peptidoglycan/xylan/chitin deacetylase (PgdA/CDA1 family)
MLKVRNITIVYFVALWFLYNTSLVDPLFFWIAVPAWLLLPISASFFICANLYLKAICKGDQGIDNVSISFNLLEPDEKWNRMNEILNHHKVPAIFFVTGNLVESKPELVTKLSDSGHIIGSHSYSVTGKFGIQSAKRLLSDLDKTEELIYEATGKDVHYFRPPRGITNPAVRKATEIMNYRVIGWNKRVQISDESLSDIPVSGIRNGSIIRIDIHGRQVPESLEKFIVSLKEYYNVVPLDELINPVIEKENVIKNS